VSAGDRATAGAPAHAAGSQHITAGALLPIAIVTLLWGCNWPVLKMGVPEVPPLTFRTLTLPFGAIGLLLIARLAGDSIRIPRAMWGKVAALAFFNITLWNGLLLFGVEQLPAGRSVILAFTMPVWSTLFSLLLLNEPLSRRKVVGLALGMLGMGLLLLDARLRRVLHTENAPGTGQRTLQHRFVIEIALDDFNALARQRRRPLAVRLSR